MNKDQIDFYNENGFLIIKDIIDKEKIKDVFAALFKVFKKYNKETRDIYLNDELWYDETFNRAMIKFRVDNPKLFSAMYDTLQTSLVLQSIFSNKDLIKIISYLLGEDHCNLSATGYMLRMDAPSDKRNVLNWHQDSFYYKQNLYGENGLVCWVPLQDVNIDNGTINICRGSHREGKIEAMSVGKKDYMTSEQFVIPDEIIKKYEQMDVVANQGDAVIFSMNMMHRSGVNISRFIRFSATARYHKILADDFLPGLVIYHPNEYMKNLLISENKEVIKNEY